MVFFLTMRCCRAVRKAGYLSIPHRDPTGGDEVGDGLVEPASSRGHVDMFDGPTLFNIYFAI